MVMEPGIELHIDRNGHKLPYRRCQNCNHLIAIGLNYCPVCKTRVGEVMKRDCVNCHFGDKTGDTPCVEQKCMVNRKHPFWQPMQNGDRLRQMSNHEIAELLDGSVIDKEDFLDWLDSEVEDDEH